jgi:hypothetical protein
MHSLIHRFKFISVRVRWLLFYTRAIAQENLASKIK